MSINTMRSLAELKSQCKSLGITVVPTGTRENKNDYILALREYFLETLYQEGIPETLQKILQIESPMLCQRYSNLRPEYQENIWNNPDVFLEEKEDGCRMVVVKIGDDWDFFSRNISVTNFLPVSYKGKIYEKWDHNIEDDFIIDDEVVSLSPQVSTILGKRGVVTTTQLQAVTALLALNEEDTIAIQKKLAGDGPTVLQFRSFDCLYHNGEWLIDKPLIERRRHLKVIMDKLQANGMNIRRPYSNWSNKRAFYKAIVSKGGEGCVAKNIYGTYIPSNSRPSDGWIKIKRSMTETIQMEGLGDTIDAFVTGYEVADETKSWAGLIGALEFSLYLRKDNGEEVVHKIARITNLTMELRKEITEVVDGVPQLRQDWYGKCASIDGVCVSGRSHRLKHAKLVEWRPDRSPDTCILEEEFLLKMVL